MQLQHTARGCCEVVGENAGPGGGSGGGGGMRDRDHMQIPAES
jgi:hypothetical protein